MSDSTDPVVASVLSQVNAHAKAARRSRQIEREKAKSAALLSERDDLQAKLKTLEAATQPAPEKDKLIAKLQSDLRTIKHQAAFEKIAHGKVHPDAIKNGSAWRLTDFPTEGDEPDPAKLSEAIERLVASNPFLVPADAPPGQPTERTPPGTGKGAPPANSFLVKREDFRTKSLDPNWVRDMLSAKAENRLVEVD